MNNLLRSGRWIFAFAIVALGAENILCATGLFPVPGPSPHSMPVLPFCRRFNGWSFSSALSG